MSKVIIDREELEDLREIVKHTEPLPGTNVHGRWGRAMSMLDAMIGKGEEPCLPTCANCGNIAVTTSAFMRDGKWYCCQKCADRHPTPPAPESVCKGCHFDGDCVSQKGFGDAAITGCLMRVPASPPESVCHRRECQRWGHCARNTDGPCAIYVRPPWVGSAPDAGKLANSISFQMTASLEAEVKDAVKALAREVVADAVKAHEAKGHSQQIGYRKTDTGCWVRCEC